MLRRGLRFVLVSTLLGRTILLQRGSTYLVSQLAGGCLYYLLPLVGTSFTQFMSLWWVLVTYPLPSTLTTLLNNILVSTRELLVMICYQTVNYCFLSN